MINCSKLADVITNYPIQEIVSLRFKQALDKIIIKLLRALCLMYGESKFWLVKLWSDSSL